MSSLMPSCQKSLPGLILGSPTLPICPLGGRNQFLCCRWPVSLVDYYQYVLSTSYLVLNLLHSIWYSSYSSFFFRKVHWNFLAIILIFCTLLSGFLFVMASLFLAHVSGIIVRLFFSSPSPVFFYVPFLSCLCGFY